MNNLIIRTDVSSSIGLGHLARNETVMVERRFYANNLINFGNKNNTLMIIRFFKF